MPLRRRSRPVRLLECDPELGVGIEEADWEIALAAAVAPEVEIARGPWRFFPPPDLGSLGALLLAGMIVVKIEAGPRAHIELLGVGDVISPWTGSGEDLAIPSVVATTALTDVRIALLDRPFSLATARWPEIHATLMHRLVLRSRRVSLQSAVNGLTRIEERLELTLWQLAYRFGRMTTHGISMQLPLTHQDLADLVAAQRPSVSTALGKLEARGRLTRADRREWLLHGDPPDLSAHLVRESGLAS